MTTIVVTYSVRRGELWRWYWKAWRKRLWRFHAVLAALILAAVFSGSGFSIESLGLGLAACAVVIGALVVYPQLMFKPQERRLVVSETGMETSIAGRGKSYRWDEVASVQQDQGAMVIALRTLNAFLVPDRAFADPEARQAFLDKVRAWFTA